jgi:hypothetical protein
MHCLPSVFLTCVACIWFTDVEWRKPGDYELLFDRIWGRNEPSIYLYELEKATKSLTENLVFGPKYGSPISGTLLRIQDFCRGFDIITIIVLRLFGCFPPASIRPCPLNSLFWIPSTFCKSIPINLLANTPTIPPVWNPI